MVDQAEAGLGPRLGQGKILKVNGKVVEEFLQEGRQWKKGNSFCISFFNFKVSAQKIGKGGAGKSGDLGTAYPRISQSRKSTFQKGKSQGTQGVKKDILLEAELSVYKRKRKKNSQIEKEERLQGGSARGSGKVAAK